MLNAASLLMTYLIAAQRKRLSLEFYARGATLFPARIAARRFVAPLQSDALPAVTTLNCRSSLHYSG
jgi:hypothetical protein